MARSVSTGYRHPPKRARFAGLSQVGPVWLKQYRITLPDSTTQPWLDEMVDQWLAQEAPGLLDRGDCGFLMIHQYAAAVHFLLPCLWCDANTLWHAVWFHDGELPGFRPFGPAHDEAEGTIRPTFFTWEMAIVAHEAAAWGRYLSSARNNAARTHWAEDVLTGMI